MTKQPVLILPILATVIRAFLFPAAAEHPETQTAQLPMELRIPGIPMFIPHLLSKPDRQGRLMLIFGIADKAMFHPTA